MPLKIVEGKSHTDHNVPAVVVGHLLEKYSDKNGFFLESIELPPELPLVPNGLYGPDVGDDPIDRSEVFMIRRNGRPGLTPMVKRPYRKTNVVTIIAGPLDEEPCGLYTMYGGSLAPKEPWDPTLEPSKKAASEIWWSEHALAIPPGHAAVRIRSINYEDICVRLARESVGWQQIDKRCEDHPKTGEPMQWLYVHMSGNQFHKLIEDLADVVW